MQTQEDEEKDDLQKQVDYLYERVEQLEQEMLETKQQQAWDLVGL